MTTTIKVTDELRDRLKLQATHDGLTLGQHLSRLTDAEDRGRRMESIGLPMTSVDRDRPNHVLAEGPTGLGRPSWIVTEQPRTLRREPLLTWSGSISPDCLARVRTWLSDHLDLPAR